MQPLDTSLILYSRPSGVQADRLGQTHYSYGFAARYFLDMFRARHVGLREIAHPEAFKSRAYAASIGLDGPGHPHLIFRSTEDIRPIGGAYNIGCFAWEFAVLSDAGPGDDPVLDNQVAMLSLCQEIWTPSTYALEVMKAHGLTNGHVIPAPIPLPDGPRLARAACWDLLSDAVSMPLVSYSSNFVTSYEADLEEDYERLAEVYARPLGEQPAVRRALESGGGIFITVLNPYDRRKNLANLIEGFLLATEGREDCVLVVKMATSGVVKDPAGYLYHQLRLLFGRPHCLNEERVVLVGDYFTEAQMNALYDGADFYLCTSIAEGQNLPLIEAMGHGCVPVSTFNTAMADYLSDGNAVRVEERPFYGLVPTLAGDVAQRRHATAFSDRFSIARAVAAALALDRGARAAKVEAGRRDLHRILSPEVVYARVRERLRRIKNGDGAAADPTPAPHALSSAARSG